MTFDAPPLPGLTAAIVDFATRPPEWSAIPDAIRQMAQAGVVDTVAVILAGLGEDSVRLLARHHGVAAGQGAPVGLGLLGRAPAATSALVDAVAAHALDYDDVGFGLHPSAVIVPTLIAGSHGARIDGRRFLTALVVGYEVAAVLAAREPGSLHEKGWHPSSALGGVAATAALGTLLGLDAGTLANALGLAAATASGLTANFGTMAKHLQVGLSARAALEAIALARAGITASQTVIEHHGGLLAALSPTGRAARGPHHFGADWQLLRTPVQVKKYPVCFGAHKALDAFLTLRESHGLRAEEIREIRLRIRPAQLAILHAHRPVDPMQARFSMEFAMASAALFGRLGLRELTPEVICSPAVQDFYSRVTPFVPDSADPSFGSEAIEIICADRRFALDGLSPPTAGTDLLPKFRDCLSGHPQIDAPALFARLSGLTDAADCAEIFTLTN